MNLTQLLYCIQFAYPNLPPPPWLLTQVRASQPRHCALSSHSQLSLPPLGVRAGLPHSLHHVRSTGSPSSGTQVLPDQIHQESGIPKSCPKGPRNANWKSGKFKITVWILANKKPLTNVSLTFSVSFPNLWICSEAYWIYTASQEMPLEMSNWLCPSMEQWPAWKYITLHLLTLLLCFTSFLPSHCCSRIPVQVKH